MNEIPSTQVIRHWVAWGVTADCPDEHSDHSIERVQQFEAWFEKELEIERDRIIEMLKNYSSSLLVEKRETEMVWVVELEKAVELIRSRSAEKQNA
jgi:hypothetical protein